MIIKNRAYALHRLGQLQKVRESLQEREKLLSPKWLEEKAFASSCNYDYHKEQGVALDKALPKTGGERKWYHSLSLGMLGIGKQND